MTGPQSLPPFCSLDAAAAWFRAWLFDSALPLWSVAGVDRSGGFRDLLTVEGVPLDAPRRARVQARQVYVYSLAAGRTGNPRWLEVARTGYAFFREHYRRRDGLFATSATADGVVLDATPRLYEQDFVGLAMAALHANDGAQAGLADEASDLLAALDAFRHPAGGFREEGEHPFQANAHMHLLEAALAWDELGHKGWGGLADEVIALAMSRFIDPAGGFLREFFDADWRPAPGPAGHWVEPGHQFEWAWLLEQWGKRRGEPGARDLAHRLFQRGRKGFDPGRGVVINVMSDDMAVRNPDARLWPQTEYLRAALVLDYPDDALAAARGLAGYLDTPARGAWRDVLDASGTFVAGPAPASSFYHLINACLTLFDSYPEPD